MPRKPPSPAESYLHKSAQRSNLPTEQTSRYMSEDDRRPTPYKPPVRSRSGPALAWDRDESLDEIETSATPLYIHEKIHPGAFAKSLSEGGDAKLQQQLFSDYNNLPDNAAYDWYQYQGNWQNRLIRGEARYVMASLLEKEGLGGKVQMIYFDPPYGISFKSNMQANARSRSRGEAAKDIPADPGIVKAFRDTYKNGIHSYLDNIYCIATHARALLNESGSFFLQIGPANVHRLAVLLDEVFGEKNRVATIPFAKSGGTSSRTLPEVADYLLWYAKDKSTLKYRQLFEPLSRPEKIEHMSSYAMVELADGSTRLLTAEERRDPDAHLPEDARLYQRMPLASPGVSTTGRSEPHEWNGTSYPCPPGEQWRVSPDGMNRLNELKRLDAAGKEGTLRWKQYEREVPGRRINNLWGKNMAPNDLHYVVETAESVIERCILMSTEPGDLVLDPTCGSGTTAFVAEKWGRRWITTDCSAVAISLARQRLATGTFDYFLLKDSREGAEKRKALGHSEEDPQGVDHYDQDPALNFVYERTPYVSAAKLAYDEPAQYTELVNQPYKKRATVRVSSPFTVESHSPYRVVNPSEVLLSERSEDSPNAMQAIIAALENSGIRSGAKRIEVEEIDEYPGGGMLTHTAQSTDGRAALFLAPDDCTVSANMINLAAEQAAEMPSVTVLIVVAFAYEPDTRMETRGRLTVHKVMANQDLRVGNLADGQDDVAFVRIGEPDIRINSLENEEISVEVVGFETYDPATRQLSRSGNAKDIYCWLLDTNYDGNSFFAHRIHFPSGKGDRQVNNFRKKLASRIKPELWEHALSTESAPFAKPKTGRIAVRLITNTHTEMTAVREVR